MFSDLTFRNSKMRLEGNSLFRQMDQDYPNSYFLYNKRDMVSWLNSRLNHGGFRGVPYRDYYKKMLKVDDDQQVMDFWKKERLRYEEDIREYFSHTKKLIEIEIEDPQFVEKLSAFLGLHLNPIYWQRRNVNSFLHDQTLSTPEPRKL